MGDLFLSSVKEVDENTSSSSLEVPVERNQRPRSRSFSIGDARVPPISPASNDLTGNIIVGNAPPNGGGNSLPPFNGRKPPLPSPTNAVVHRGNSKLKYEISAEQESEYDGSEAAKPESIHSDDFHENTSTHNVETRSRKSVDGDEEITKSREHVVDIRAPASLGSPMAISPTAPPPYSSPTKASPPDPKEKEANDGKDGEKGGDKPKSQNPSPHGTNDRALAKRSESKKSALTPPSAWSWNSLLFSPIEETDQSFVAWSIFINILHAIEIILIPIQLAWTEYFINIGVVIVQLFVDILFLFDCLLLSRIIFKDEYGITCTDPKRLRGKYLWKEFGIVKVLASLPLEILMFLPKIPYQDHFPLGVPFGYDFTMYSQFKYWALVCFLKMLIKIPYKRIYSIAIPGIAMPISRLIKTMLILMLMGHYDACLFWFIDQYLPPPNRWVDHLNLMPSDIHTNMFTTQYLVSYLSALRSLVLHLREVEIDAENIYVVFEFVFGILAYGTVFGNIHSIVEMLDNTAASNQAEEQHKFQMEWLKNYMREKRLMPEIQKMVTAHKELQWQKSKGMDESKMFEDLPRSVQQQIKNFLYLDLVKKVPIFQGTDLNFQNVLCFKIRSVHVLDGWFIFRKGDEGDEMYFIKSGEVVICNDEGVVFVTLSTGSFFGEIALFEACKRTAAAKAKGNVELCMLKKDDFVQIMDTYPAVAERIRDTIRTRKEQEEKIKAEKAREEARKEEEARRKAENRWSRRRSSRLTMSGASSKKSLDASNSVFNVISRNLSLRSRINKSTSQSIYGSSNPSVLSVAQQHHPNPVVDTAMSNSMAMAKSRSVMQSEQLDKLWDYSKPKESEDKFRALLAETAPGALHAEIKTQIARTLGLQKRFDEAKELLDVAKAEIVELEKILDQQDAPSEDALVDLRVARARHLLEYGRMVRSSGDPEGSIRHFRMSLQTTRLGPKDRLEYYEVDALHMLAIVEPEDEEKIRRTQEAITICEKSSFKRTQGWTLSLLNNLGWTYHDAKEYEAALEQFKKAEAFGRKMVAEGDKSFEEKHRIAKWTVARALRSLERLDEALEILEGLLKGVDDVYVFEELALVHDGKGNKEEAKSFAGKALQDNAGDIDGERLEKLKVLAGSQ
ncbi:hypothetical protein HDU97_007173 [Phlyctochytrium planicorne]|nr:hypothetical protein HDU97_007173 [Phlyctochytrium planicorne]